MGIPNEGGTHGVKDVDIQPNNGETIDADMQTNYGERESADVEAQPGDSKVQPFNEETKQADEVSLPNNAEKEPADAQTSEIQPIKDENGEAKPVDEEMCTCDGETQPLGAQVQLVNGAVHLDDVQLHPLEVQPNSGGLRIRDAGMETIDVKIEPVIENLRSCKGELQTADSNLAANNGELQPFDAHMHPDSGGMHIFGAETHLKNEEIQSFYAEFQTDNGDMHSYNPETHSLDLEIPRYDTEVQLHGGQIEPYNPEMQEQDGQIQPYHLETQAQDGQIQPYHPETQAQDGQIQPYNPETHPNKRRKKKSMVWEHFTIETVSPDCRRASCNRCKQSFAYSTGSKVAGTSHLKRHIVRGTCTSPLQNQGSKQLSPYTPSPRMPGICSVSGQKRRYRSSNTPYVPFDQEHCRQDIAKMIIMHEYPLDMVEHPGFVSFVQSLQPQFNVGSFSTVQGDCIAAFLSEKQNVVKLVKETTGRVCLTLDLWTSNQTTCYVVITGHFIDSDWKFNRRILNVILEPYPDSDTVLGDAISVCLSEWSLERNIFSVTFNQKLNEAGLENLRAYLAVKNPRILSGQLLIGNCIGHTLGCMAKDLLGAGQDIVEKIRDSVKYVKTSDSHEEKFLDLKRQLQVPSQKKLLLDDQTKWNTTYEMLLAASELKEVFSCLDTTDPDYKNGPSMEVWKQVETLCRYLKLLYDAANILTNTLNPTPITCFHEVWKIHSELGRAVSSEDPFVVHLTRSMHDEIVKYWKDCSLILAMAVVMDPRFKMKLVEFIFTKLYSEDAPIYVRIIDEGIHELFDEYATLPLPLTPAYAEERHGGNTMRTDEQGEMLLSDHGMADFDMYIMETTGQRMKSEIDQYLEEALLPRVQEVDVLSWWKLNILKYPTLSRMARDILTTPMCSVTSETIFDTIPKRIDAFRSTLRPVTVEALICAKDWLQHGSSEASNAPP